MWFQNLKLLKYNLKSGIGKESEKEICKRRVKKNSIQRNAVFFEANAHIFLESVSEVKAETSKSKKCKFAGDICPLRIY